MGLFWAVSIANPTGQDKNHTNPKMHNVAIGRATFRLEENARSVPMCLACRKFPCSARSQAVNEDVWTFLTLCHGQLKTCSAENATRGTLAFELPFTAAQVLAVLAGCLAFHGVVLVESFKKAHRGSRLAPRAAFGKQRCSFCRGSRRPWLSVDVLVACGGSHFLRRRSQVSSKVATQIPKCAEIARRFPSKVPTVCNFSCRQATSSPELTSCNESRAGFGPPGS